MASSIDPTQPPTLNPTTAAMRANMAAAKSEIEALQTTTPFIRLVGAAWASTTTETSLPTGVNTKVALDFVKYDNLNVFDAVSHAFIIPDDIDYVQIAASVEYWKENTGFGNSIGQWRRVSAERSPGGLIIGAAPLTFPPSQVITQGVNAALTSSLVKFDISTYPNGVRGIRLMAYQDSGITCKVGGAGGGQTYLGVQMFKTN